MNGYYQHQRQFSAEDLQHAAHMNNQDTVMGMTGQNGLNNAGMIGGQSLDEMIHQNEKEIQRRRSFHQSHSYGSNESMYNDDPRRTPIMEFGSRSNNDLDGFQFDPSPVPVDTDMHRSGNIAHRRLDSHGVRRQMPNDSLALNTNYSTMASPYTSMTSSSPYGQALNSTDPLSGFDMSNDYMSNNFLGMDFMNTPIDNGTSSGRAIARDPFPQATFSPAMHQPQMQQNISTSSDGRMHDPGGGLVASSAGNTDIVSNSAGVPVSNPMDAMNSVQTRQNNLLQSKSAPMPNANSGIPVTNTSVSPPVSGSHGLPTYDMPSKAQPSVNLDIASKDSSVVPFKGQNGASQQVTPQYRNAYSSSGFDMLGVLIRVATRPNPQINIGAVDMSCAFVVCDATQHDIPIVYCSDVFERLTAYTRHEILGRNCRFLQAPDGKIQAGVKRKYVDDQSVLKIKNMVTARQETQISLINYRKGGQPFMNLLTMIPITWDTDEIKYYVGFQVDLVEQPTSITNKNPGKHSLDNLLLRPDRQQMDLTPSITSVAYCQDTSYQTIRTK